MNSLSFQSLGTKTAKEFLYLEPEKNNNYIYVIEDDGCLELFKDLADITVSSKNLLKNVTYIAICVWVDTERFELHLPISVKNMIMESVRKVSVFKKPYLKILIGVADFPASGVSIQEIILGKTITQYYFNPYSKMWFRKPF